MNQISLHTVPFDAPDAHMLVNAFHTDQLTRYDRADPPEDNPRDYDHPQGLFLLLRVNDQPAGCGGYRVHDTTTGEIKRLPFR